MGGDLAAPYLVEGLADLGVRPGWCIVGTFALACPQGGSGGNPPWGGGGGRKKEPGAKQLTVAQWNFSLTSLSSQVQ